MEQATLQAATYVAKIIAQNGPQSVDVTLEDGRKICGRVINVLSDVWKCDGTRQIDVVLLRAGEQFLINFETIESFITCDHTVN